jgi:mannose-1-phosphate guanylyltransferase
MRALVLAAGLGTRLRPLTDVRAKPAIPVAGTPMIRRIVAWLSTNGVVDIVVNLHALPHTVTAVLGDGSDLSVGIRYSWEQPRILGSAGGPRHALSMLGTDPFVIVNGDTLTDLSLGELARVHGDTGALVTLALVPNRAPERYGGVLLGPHHRVLGFVPRGRAAADSYHFVGVQMAGAEAFRSLPDGQPAGSIGGVYDRLLASSPGSIRGFVSDAAFSDIGTPSDYFRTSADYLHTEQRGSDSRLLAGGTIAGRNLRMGAAATVRDSILWDDVVLGDDCFLDHCIVTDRVEVPGATRYRNAILVASESAAPIAFPFETSG